MTTEIYCPKCNSRTIKHERFETKPTLVSMDDLAIYNAVQVVPLVLHRATWHATCTECGYFVTYEGA